MVQKKDVSDGKGIVGSNICCLLGEDFTLVTEHCAPECLLKLKKGRAKLTRWVL
jgi:hypothetical protein